MSLPPREPDSPGASHAPLVALALAVLVLAVALTALMVRHFTELRSVPNAAAGDVVTLLNQWRLQSRLNLAVALALGGSTFAFAALAWRSLVRLRRQRDHLTDLAVRLGEAQRQAEQANAAKSAFLAHMSHEIRTPFHGLMGMLTVLREAPLNPEQRLHLQAATESADHLLALLNDILDLSQLDSGRLTLAPVPVDLRQLLGEVEALMRPQAGAKSLVMHVDVDPAVPERVNADPTRVRQVLFNLLSNAIRYTERGSVTLSLATRSGARHGHTPVLAFSVTDTGIGLDEAAQAALFQRSTTGPVSPGTRGGAGLGLEISRNLARLMGGDIEVRSKPGEGSRFTFWLPLEELAAAEPRAPAAVEATAGAPRLRLLVAEDHPVNRQVMAALLQRLGHHTTFAGDGAEALDWVSRQPFDAVLMDLHMPKMDGLQATRAIRALPDPRRAAVPVVALTADAYPETQARCAAVGMNDFLAKPVRAEALAASLRRLFGRTSATPEGPAAASTPSAASLLDEPSVAHRLQLLGPAEFKRLAEAVLQQGEETVVRLRHAVREGQADALRLHAHAAKGAALDLGLAGLAQVAQSLQDGAAHLPAHEVARRIQQFESLLPATRTALDERLGRSAA